MLLNPHFVTWVPLGDFLQHKIITFEAKTLFFHPCIETGEGRWVIETVLVTVGGQL